MEVCALVAFNFLTNSSIKAGPAGLMPPDYVAAQFPRLRDCSIHHQLSIFQNGIQRTQTLFCFSNPCDLNESVHLPPPPCVYCDIKQRTLNLFMLFMCTQMQMDKNTRKVRNQDINPCIEVSLLTHYILHCVKHWPSAGT